MWASRVNTPFRTAKTTHPGIERGRADATKSRLRGRSERRSELARQATQRKSGTSSRWVSGASGYDVSTARPTQATAQSTLVKVPMMNRSAAPESSWLRSSG